MSQSRLKEKQTKLFSHLISVLPIQAIHSETEMQQTRKPRSYTS